MALCSPIHRLCETNWARRYRNLSESILENIKKDSTTLCTLVKECSGTLRNPVKQRVYSFYYPNGLSAISLSHRHVLSSFQLPRLSTTNPRKLLFRAISAQSRKQRNERASGGRAGSPTLKMKGNLCSSILSHLSTAARLQSRHAETTTASGRADEQRFCTVTVCGSCN